MSFNQNNVNELANLAQLSIKNIDDNTATPEQTKLFAHSIADDLRNILHMMDEINKIDTTNIQPMSHPVDCVQKFRQDIISESNVRDVMQHLTAADGIAHGCYLVPNVITAKQDE